MCSIMGYCGRSIKYHDFLKGFNQTLSRGPDATKVIEIDQCILGFHRLSIMGIDQNGMQPFSYNDKYLVCNGEIYGFRKIKDDLIKKGITFKSGSDCEILLPLYEEKGDKMFKELDGEFALIIYNQKNKQLIAARDPIGIRPLFYGYDQEDKIIFASEAKNLVGLCKKVFPFPPGYYYKDGKFICYHDISAVNKYHSESIKIITDNIHNLLVAGIKKRLDSDVPLGFLLSGGLDSSLVCAVSAKILDKPINTFAIGMNEDAIDLKYAREVANYIKSNHTEVIITKEDVINALEEVIKILGTYDITTIRASIGMYLICKYIHENSDIRVLLTGEVSDELFGYKYTDFAPNSDEFQKEAQKRVKELYMYDVLRADRCISVNSLEARVPFGDLAFVEYVMSINPKIKMNTYGKGKYLLRRAFVGDYLPEKILMREKAAFSDAVGHSLSDELKRYANVFYSDEEYMTKKKQYSDIEPFSKEALLYREIFEKYYPHQAHMIKDYWMPNKNWPGCQVDDPSARVLSNYGDSGK